MPVTREFRGPVLILRTSGTYTNEELETAIREAPKDPAFHAGTAVFVDGRLSEAPLTTTDVRRRIALLGELRALGFASRVAMVIKPEDLLRQGLSRQLTMSVESAGITLHVFETDEKAIAWLLESSSS
jgi:hypothetical protein